MKRYLKPQMQISYFQIENIITTSGVIGGVTSDVESDKSEFDGASNKLSLNFADFKF